MKSYYRVTSDESIAAERIETLEGAQTRAEELAAKYPGRSFEILRCVGYASTSKASTFWMDGECPPEKPRYRTLEDGEVIQKGDEFTQNNGASWRAATTGIGNKYRDLQKNILSPHFPHRRPL